MSLYSLLHDRRAAGPATRDDLAPPREWPPPAHAWHPGLPRCLHGRAPEIRVNYDDGDTTIGCIILLQPCLPHVGRATRDLAEAAWTAHTREFRGWLPCPAVDALHRGGRGPDCPVCGGTNRVPPDAAEGSPP